MQLNRAFPLVICGLALTACSSFSMPGFDAMKQKPENTFLLLQSTPAGAEARSSLGPACRTPCTMSIGSGSDFTVSYSLDGYLPQTVTVHSTMSAGGFMTAPSPLLNPNPVFAALEPAAPETKATKPSARQRPQSAAAVSQLKQ
jgi:hypothetical protein